MRNFGPDQARQVAGPFVDERVTRAERAAAAPWPTTDEEVWRYSRIDDLRLDDYRPAALDTRVDGAGEYLVEPSEFASLYDDAPDVFADLNAAFATPTVLRIPARTVVDSPIVITHHVPGDGAAVFPRTIVEVGSDAEVTIIERFVSSDGSEAFVAPVVEVRADAAARVSYVSIEQLGPSVWTIGHQRCRGDRDSSVSVATVALGADYARMRSAVKLSGAGASARQTALYFAAADQMHDFRTTQDHDAPHTTSELLFKGAVADRARSVYTGLIKVREHAGGTNAFQTNRNLTLGADAWAESVPNLDIQTNDVRCSHASTVGPIDADQRFYLESRGIPTELAERLIVLGFFDEVLEHLPVGDLADELRAAVAAKFADAGPVSVEETVTV